MAMSEPVLTSFLAEAPKLTKAQRARVEAALLASKPVDGRRAQDGFLVWQAVERALRARGLVAKPYAVWAKRRGYLAAAGALRAWAAPASENQAEELTALATAIELVLYAEAERNLPADEAYLAHVFPALPSILEAAFPGYRASGLLRMALLPNSKRSKSTWRNDLASGAYPSPSTTRSTYTSSQSEHEGKHSPR